MSHVPAEAIQIGWRRARSDHAAGQDLATQTMLLQGFEFNFKVRLAGSNAIAVIERGFPRSRGAG
jgi:hypothetical protein